MAAPHVGPLLATKACCKCNNVELSHKVRAPALVDVDSARTQLPLQSLRDCCTGFTVLALGDMAPQFSVHHLTPATAPGSRTPPPNAATATPAAASPNYSDLPEPEQPKCEDIREADANADRVVLLLMWRVLSIRSTTLRPSVASLWWANSVSLVAVGRVWWQA